MDKYSSRFTPVDDLDQSCKITEVSLCIYGVNPDMIIEKLQIYPTRMLNKGTRSIISGREVVNKVNSWVLSSEGIASKDLRTHLDWLLEKVHPVMKQILELQKSPDVKMSIRCYWVSAESGGGPTLWPEQMEKMAELNLECNFNCEYFGDNE